VFDTEQKVRRDQHGLERQLNPLFRRLAVSFGDRDEPDERRHLGLGHRPAIGAARQGADNLLHAGRAELGSQIRIRARLAGAAFGLKGPTNTMPSMNLLCFRL